MAEQPLKHDDIAAAVAAKVEYQRLILLDLVHDRFHLALIRYVEARQLPDDRIATVLYEAAAREAIFLFLFQDVFHELSVVGQVSDVLAFDDLRHYVQLPLFAIGTLHYDPHPCLWPQRVIEILYLPQIIARRVHSVYRKYFISGLQPFSFGVRAGLNG